MKSAFIYCFKMEAILKGQSGKDLEWQIAEQMTRSMKRIDHPLNYSTVFVSVAQMEHAFHSIELFRFCKNQYTSQVWDNGLKLQLFKRKDRLSLDRLIHKLLKFVELENKQLYWTVDVEQKILSKIQHELSSKVNEVYSKMKSFCDQGTLLKRRAWELMTEQQDCLLSMKQCEYLEIRAQQYMK